MPLIECMEIYRKLLLHFYGKKCSFYPKTIKDWNILPINVIEARDIN